MNGAPQDLTQPTLVSEARCIFLKKLPGGQQERWSALASRLQAGPELFIYNVLLHFCLYGNFSSERILGARLQISDSLNHTKAQEPLQPALLNPEGEKVQLPGTVDEAPAPVTSRVRVKGLRAHYTEGRGLAC